MCTSEAREGPQTSPLLPNPAGAGLPGVAPVMKSGEQPEDDSSTGRVAHGSQGAVLRAR